MWYCCSVSMKPTQALESHLWGLQEQTYHSTIEIFHAPFSMLQTLPSKLLCRIWVITWDKSEWTWVLLYKSNSDSFRPVIKVNLWLDKWSARPAERRFLIHLAGVGPEIFRNQLLRGAKGMDESDDFGFSNIKGFQKNSKNATFFTSNNIHGTSNDDLSTPQASKAKHHGLPFRVLRRSEGCRSNSPHDQDAIAGKKRPKSKTWLRKLETEKEKMKLMKLWSMHCHYVLDAKTVRYDCYTSCSVQLRLNPYPHSLRCINNAAISTKYQQFEQNYWQWRMPWSEKHALRYRYFTWKYFPFHSFWRNTNKKWRFAVNPVGCWQFSYPWNRKDLQS